VTEIYVNPQEGVVRADTRSRGTVTTAERMPGNRVEMLLNDVAASIGEHLTPEIPRLHAELPKSVFRGSRLQGFVAPVSSGPSFTIRKPPTVIDSLDDYAAAAVIRAARREEPRRAVADHRSVVVAGGTNTGKTTLANALLREITESASCRWVMGQNVRDPGSRFGVDFRSNASSPQQNDENRV
jgi:type IV secretion system protein VirB11